MKKAVAEVKKPVAGALISKHRHVGIGVSDMEASLRFYCGLLGHKVVCNIIEEGKYFSDLVGIPDCKVRAAKISAPDGSVIELIQFLSVEMHKPAKIAYNYRGTNHIAFTVDDIDTVHARLRSAGIRFVSPPLASPYDPVKTCFCFDPDGTYVQFVEITDKRSIRPGLR